MKLILGFYTGLLYLYPSNFRSEFGEEMRMAFADALADAARRGIVPLMRRLFREISGLPGALIREHWSNFWRWFKEASMNDQTLSHEGGNRSGSADTPGSGWQVLLAGLPHLLFGLLTGTGRLANVWVSENQAHIVQRVEVVFGVGIMLLVVGMFFYAWKQKWPLWSASWLGYFSWIVLVLLGLGIMALPIEEDWRFTNFLIIAWLGAFVTGYFWIYRTDARRGLLAVLFLLPMAYLWFLEFIPDWIEGVVGIGSGLTAALTAGLIVRGLRLPGAVGLVAGINLLIGLILAYVSEYLPDYPLGIPHTPSLNAFAGGAMMTGVIMLAVILGPLVFWGLWDFGKRKLTA